MDQDHVDGLLERYLSLLDEYTRLRTRLSALQSDVFHGIARANFAGERGLRYGRDQYDERMQASRLLEIASRDGDGKEDEQGLVEFTVARKVEEEEDGEEKETGEDGRDSTSDGDDGRTASDENKKQEDETEKPAVKTDDPLRWFGLLAPMPLRNAQTQSIEAVEQVIPRIATVSAEMFNLEIEVRRARKKRAKAEAAERKEKQARETETTNGEKVTATATPTSVGA